MDTAGSLAPIKDTSKPDQPDTYSAETKSTHKRDVESPKSPGERSPEMTKNTTGLICSREKDFLNVGFIEMWKEALGSIVKGEGHPAKYPLTGELLHFSDL